MKRIKVSKKFLAILLSTGIIVSFSSCSTSDEKDISNMSGDTFLDLETGINNGISTSEVSLVQEPFDYFFSDLAEVKGMIDDNRIDEIKSKAKDILVTGIDFIFYDETISGVSFDELTETGKEITMNNLAYLGDMVNQVIPGWKDGLSDKYYIASEFVDNIYLLGLDKIREYLGDENYEALADIKKKIYGDVQDTYDDIKEYVKSWYEDFRSG